MLAPILRGSILACLLAAGSAVAEVDLEFGFDDSLSSDDGSVTGTVYVFPDQGEVFNNPDGFRAFVNASPTFGAEAVARYLSLGADDYLGIPPEVLAEFDVAQAIQFDIGFRFRVEEPVAAPSPCCPDYVHRPVLTTNDGDQRSTGFSLRVYRIDGRWELGLATGAGINEETGFENEGYFFALGRVEPDTWIDLSLIFHIDDVRPRVEALLDGRPINGGIGNPSRIDLELLAEHFEGGPGLSPGAGIETAQVFVGGFPVLNPRGAAIDLDIDRLTLQSPKAPGDADELSQILERFTRAVRGDYDPGDDALRVDIQRFLATFDGNWEALEANIVEFLDAYETAYPPLFESPDVVSIDSFDPPTLLAFFLQQWMLDTLFVDGRVGEVAGIGFEAAESYPGPVADDAPRVTGTVGVDASYRTDPAVALNGDETVLRPTGFYAAPGEAVTIRVPGRAAGIGIKVRIGIHRADMEQSWTIFNRFPRISNTFSLDATEITVANPFGGGIYFEVPDGADAGVISARIEGAVRMPMFSTLGLPGHSDDLAAFQAAVDDWHVPWFELHGRNFSTTEIMNVARLYDDPAFVLETYEDAFDQVNRMAGRPTERHRPEWLVTDRWVTFRGTAIAASYPIYPNRDIGERFDHYPRDTYGYSARTVVLPDFFDPPSEDFLPERYANYILWHEWGHLHNLPTLRFQEQESNVHLLAAVVYNETLGADLDTALARSGFQGYGFDDAALDTMFSPSWQAGERLSEGEQVYGIWDNEVRYQTRSWARIVEIAGLYSWDAVGAIHGAFYDRGVETGTAVNYGLEDDDFIETGSRALGLNLSPIFDFWGVPPSDEAAARLADLPVPMEFLERLENYRALAPRNDAQFGGVYDRLTPTASNEGRIRYDYYRDVFDADMGRSIVRRIDEVACRYLGCLNNDGTAAPENVQATDGELADRVGVSWDAVDEATRYEVYRCPTGGSLNDCRRLATVTGTSIEDGSAGDAPGRHFYRVRACTRPLSCSGFSAADVGSVAEGLVAVDVSGPWFNTDQPGHGWFVEQLAPSSDGEPELINAYWYVYRDGAPVWLLGIGPLVNGVAELDVLATAGGQFPPNFDPDDVELIPWGTLTFEFASDEEGTARWAPVLEGFDAGELAIRQIAPIEDSAAACASGSYYNLDQPGHGFVAQVLSLGGETQVLLAWYVYLDGQQVWLLGQALLVDGLATVPMAAFDGAGFPPDFDAGDVVSTPWGTVELRFTDPDSATVNWTTDVPDYSNGSLDLARLTTLSGHACGGN